MYYYDHYADYPTYSAYDYAYLLIIMLIMLTSKLIISIAITMYLIIQCI